MTDLEQLEALTANEEVLRILIWPQYSQGFRLDLQVKGGTLEFDGLTLADAIEAACKELAQ